MQDFTGIAEKLVRAEQNIFNLHYEMEGFFEESEYPVFPKNNGELLAKAIEYQRSRVIPVRFGVLAGEVIHHLRSCFDHIVWHFSTGPKQNNIPVDFPVFKERPIQKNELSRFEGKIQRITNTKVVNLIKHLQPYNAVDPSDDCLWILHDLDIVDKHKELVLCVGTGSIVLPPEMGPVVRAYRKQHPEATDADIANGLKNYGVAQPCISFRDFGRREIEPVTIGLLNLFNYTIRCVNQFKVL